MVPFQGTFVNLCGGIYISMVLLLKCILVHATPKFRFYNSLGVLIVLKDTKDHACLTF